MVSFTRKKGSKQRVSMPLIDELPSAKSQNSSQDGSTMNKLGVFPRLADIDWSYAIWFAKVLTIMVPIGIALAVPVIIYRNDQEVLEDESFDAKQYRQLLFYLFKWLLATWVGGCVSFLLATGLPYLYRFAWRFVCDIHTYSRIAANDVVDISIPRRPSTGESSDFFVDPLPASAWSSFRTSLLTW